MGLDSEILKTQIEESFAAMQTEPVPKDPDEVAAWQNTLLKQLASDLAEAIGAFVRSGEVVNVKTTVEVDPETGIMTGTQTGAGEIR